MENKNIDYGKVLLKVLELLIVKVFTLPFKIYQNALIHLSNTDAEDSEEKNLSGDFPLYVWFVSLFNVFIVLSYPIGFVIATYRGVNTYNDQLISFITILVITYFYPLLLGLMRELWLITLKSLLYLKIISKK
jgi:hypothetical protein